MHPREGGRKRPFAPLSRRDFLRNSGLTAASLPLASAILAACGKPGDSNSSDGFQDPTQHPARPNDPITLPVNQEMMIGDDLKPEAGPLEIYNWEEYVNPRVIGMFEDQYGVKVNINTFNTMSEAISTLTTTADAKYDVFVTDVDQVGKLAYAGVLRPLNHNYLKNLGNTWTRFHADQPTQPWYDVGAHFTVPYTTYTTGVAWRIDKGGPSEEEVLSMDNPWEILWDTKYKGKIHILDDYREAIGMAMLKNGITDVNADDASTRTASLEKARADLLALVATVDVKADISDYSDLPEGVSLIHHGWSGDFLAAKWYFPKDTKDRDVIRYWTPKTKGPAGNDTITVPSGGKNPVLAHHFLNFMLDHDNALVNFQWNGYVPPQSGIEPKDLTVGSGGLGAIVFPGLETAINTEQEIENGVFFAELTPDVNNQFQDVWESFQSA